MIVFEVVGCFVITLTEHSAKLMQITNCRDFISRDKICFSIKIVEKLMIENYLGVIAERLNCKRKEVEV